MKWVSKLIKKLLIRFGVIAIICVLLFSLTPIVAPKGNVSPQQVQSAKNVVKKVWEQLASNQTQAKFTLNQEELNDLTAIAGHTLKGSSFAINVSSFGVNIASSLRIPILSNALFINGYCLYGNELSGFAMVGCKLGKVPIPAFIAELILNAGLWLVFGDEIKQNVNALIASAKPNGDTISFDAKKSANFKDAVKASLSTASQLASAVTPSQTAKPVLVKAYIDHILATSQTNKSLSFFIGQVFAKAQLASLDGADPVEENRAALWALAIVFGSERFAVLSDIDISINANYRAVTTLNGRGDLSLHFLYSSILEQVGKENIGLSIGELKELLDSNEGGSGYSFADLAADKAGMAFSKFVTSNDESAIYAQDLLAYQTKEELFLPAIHDLPEGFRGEEFNEIIGYVGSSVYNEIESRIDKRIISLPLYSSGENKRRLSNEKHHIPKQNINGSYANGIWLNIDTHIHTRYSDGNKSVSEIAERASQFGCDAIAITDHGDYNLKDVASTTYFDDITQVNDLYPHLTVMPGLEWNVPPFMGREHATVLLPESPDLQTNLEEFKSRFDSYGRRKKEQLSISSAAEWLNNIGHYGTVNPVVIYNHPNRKDVLQNENTYDLAEWMDRSDSFIGFAGAPGHQKMAGTNNGAYSFRQKTIHRWDPAVQPGNTWDTLLQQGYDVWGARAGSDFHSTDGDYWPCEFSTTHLFSRSNSHNDILQALRSGNTWAQHGKFVNQLNFYIKIPDKTATMGETVAVDAKDAIEINALITLNEKDWQGYSARLDELELIIIEQNDIQVVPFEPALLKSEVVGQLTQLHMQYRYRTQSKNTVFRLRGRSIQPEQHHYMFYSNPIRVMPLD
ncbi:PHP domain-containing protein [Alteromonas sp. Cnat3-28]|uniref:PHP domain-containing protein n=1 Tax=Alteromonas sp. Cnat3-28 TaxID=2917729 RepID=UPI001EF50802|nr:PHP domain-containing protein [Alteromonas sp. Cnat3-28]MCG7644910.1 PHP domain-containing protein [Alteromonas sp. Cnat3-28]